MIFAIVWIVCGVLAYGITLAWNRGKWPKLAEEWRGRDIGFSVFVGLYGPIGLIVAFFMSENAKYGLKFR